MSLSHGSDPTPARTLSAPDTDALDALVDAGFDPARVPEPLRRRAGHIARVLSLLDTRISGDAVSLTNRTLEAVRNASQSRAELTLVRDDELALEALAASGFDPSKVPDPYRTRAERHSRLADAVTKTVPPDLAAPDIAQRTFDLVMVAADRPALKFQATEPSGYWRRTNVLDLVGVAAMLLVGASVVWPALTAVQQRQARTGCLANFGAVASAMSSYAGDHRDSLPVATASLGGTWWDVGNPLQSNSANLFTLARTGYSAIKNLACPANLRACSVSLSPQDRDWQDIRDVSYSYQVMFGSTRPRWNGPARVVVLADRSPIILRNRRHETAFPLENSPNHGQSGQDVLFCDGSAMWLTSPELPSGDNIWLPRAVEDILRHLEGREAARLYGDELPGSEQDTFLGP